jgi:phosphatidylglycerol lysyltransferase
MKRATPQLPPGCEHYASQADLPAELAAGLRQRVFEFGDTYSSSLATESDREYFWGSQRRGVVAFRRRGRYAMVADGLLADPDDRETLLAEFLAFTAANRWHASCINVPRNEINMFRRAGCEVTKMGEEPLVRLQSTRFQGKTWEWVRRQENFCRRQGVEFQEIDAANDPSYHATIAPQLEEISSEHIAGTLHRRELSFVVSQFDARDVRDRRLFVAREKDRIVAFVVCNPGLGGDMWAIEVYRRRRDAVRGVVPALIMHALRTMQSEGVSFASLSLCPFLRCTPVAGDSAAFRYMANFWWRRLNSIYDMQGLFHFKSRFRPEYREMFIAAQPRTTIRSMWAIAMEWKLLHFNPLRLLPGLFRKAQGGDRRQLAMPDRSSDVLIRDLRAKLPQRVAAQTPLAVVSDTTADTPA